MRKHNEIMFEVLKSEIYNVRPIKIKTTYDFKLWLVAHDKVSYIKNDSKRGFYVAFNLIPIEIDDTIKSEYYELIYEEN